MRERAKNPEQFRHGRPPPRPQAVLYGVISVLISVATVLSTLALIVDRNFASLPSPVGSLVHVYDRLVTTAAAAVFGWIDFWWMRFTAFEAHVAVVATAVLAAVAWRTRRSSALASASLTHQGWIVLLFALFQVFIIATPLIILPGPWGAFVTTVNLAVLASAAFRAKSR